jgi:hypothetical protein
MQQEQNVVDMLDEVFVKGATSPKCGKRISSVSSGHGASGVAFARASAAAPGIDCCSSLLIAAWPGDICLGPDTHARL